MTQPPFALHNPALLPADVLLAEFTARRPLLETLLDVVRSNKPGQPPQHCLLIGARGMGKTTTLWAVAHRVNRDLQLASQWQPVVFDEESRRVGDLADFWLEAIRQWEHAVQDSADRAGGLLAQATADIEDRAQSTFLELVQRSGKGALLLVDNLNNLLVSIRDPAPLHRLRAFLMQESRVVILGAATRYFEEITSVDQPFYDFFRCFELRPLSLEDMQTCLMTLAQTRQDESIKQALENRSGTVQALHLLTGGNPRLVKTFYRLLRDGLRGDIRTHLEKLLDEFTPYFKAIVDALPVQQQRILDAVAMAWDPVEVATIATFTRLPSNQVSAQLRALTKAGLVSEAIGHPKRKSYLLTDRFSNIHYLMRHGRAARNRLDWFVALVRLVFPDRQATDMLARVSREAAECGPDGQRDAWDVLQSALKRTQLAESRRALLHATLRENWDRATWESLDRWFDTERAKQDIPEIEIVAFCQRMPLELRKEIGYEPENSGWWYNLTRFLEVKEMWRLAEGAYRKAIELDPKDPRPWTGLGMLFMVFLKRPAEAEAAYRRAIELDPKNALLWTIMGNLLMVFLRRPAEAEAAFRRAIELNPNHASTWTCLGILLMGFLDRPAEAEAAYRKAIDLAPMEAHPWTCLGILLMKQLGNPADAEASFRKAIELDSKDASPWISLGALLEDHLGSLTEAEAAYRKAIELDPGDASPWISLGALLEDHLGDLTEAETAYRKAIELNPKTAYPWIRLGILLMTQDGRSEESEAAYRKAIELKPEIGKAWALLGLLMDRRGRPVEAEAAYRNAIELDPKDASAWTWLGNLLVKRRDRPVEAEVAYRKAIELDPTSAYPWNCLADFLSKKAGASREARACAVTAMQLKPDNDFSRIVFHRVCGYYAEDWRAVLPALAGWCAAHPNDRTVFDFTVDGFVELAQLTKPRDVLPLLESLPDTTPFETLRDAFRSHVDRDYLNRLAPERQQIALELLKRISEPSA